MPLPMTGKPDDILDDLFHGCALRAYLEVLAESGLFPPDSEATRRRAYHYYEAELAAKNRRHPAGTERSAKPVRPRSQLVTDDA
jgi:hypothetical protein